MQVVLVSLLPAKRPGGLPLYVRQLSRRLGAAGVGVDLIGFGGHAEDAEYVAGETGAAVYLSPWRRRSELRVPSELGRELAERIARAELVHLHGMRTRLNHAAAQLARKHGKPLLVSPHGQLHPWQMGQRRARKWLVDALWDRPTYAAARGIIAVSEEEAGHCRAFARSTPVVTIPPGVDALPPAEPRVVERLLTDFPALRGRRALVYLADLNTRKGPDLLAEAWRLAGPGVSGSALVLAGRATEFSEEQAADWVGKASASAPIVRIAQVRDEERAALMSLAHGFILPTRAEAFGIAIGEALSTGTPVITTTAAPWQVLREAGCGWWVEPRPDRLADAIVELMTVETEEHEALRRRAERLYAERLTPAREVERILGVYRQAIAGEKVGEAQRDRETPESPDTLQP